MSFFKTYGFISKGMLHVSAREAIELCSKGAVLIDVREEILSGFKHFDVEKVIYLPASRFEKECDRLNRDFPYIFADSVGLHSIEIAHLAVSKGFKKVANLAGGILEWERDGFPLIVNNSEQLSGSCVCQLKYRNR